MARTALDAINETERLVCGTGAVLRPAIAEGLALEGRPAATLLATGDHGGDCAFTCAPWVHHRLRSGPSSGFAFELTASVSQDAVDHCLVAHELARRIGAPGICTFDPPPAGPLELLRLPHDALVRELTDEPVMDVGSVANEATRAFRRVAGLTGRPLAAVTCDGPQGAEYGLVTGGASRAATRRLALALEAGGLPCRVICIHLIRPFPVFALAEAVSGLAGVLLIPGVDHVVEATRRACIEGGHPQPPVLLDPLDPRDVDDTSAAARLALGLKPARHREASPPVGVPPIVLTARPPGGWAESFLLDLAARLGSIEEVPFRRVGSNLRVGEGDPETGTAAPADLALCAHRSCLDRRSLPAAMARGGTLVIVSRSPVPTDWWNGLRPEVRYEILQRELRLNWLDLGNTPQLELADPAAVRSIVLDGFLAAAAPSLDRVLAREIGSRLAPAALTVLDPTALEAERSAAEADFISPPDSLPTMPPTPSLPNEEASGDADEWRVATRRFHLTGEGAHSAMEPTGAEPLHPLVLEALDLPQRKGASYPMLVFGDPAEEIAEPFERRVAAIFREMASQGEAAAVLPEHLPQLSAAAARVVARGTTPTELGLQVTETLDELRQRFDLSEAAATALR
ncbi:MAG: hypothetical protein OEV00_08830, partial [Acidobacteriota bacterium]|nr:hypothetical protein [Acidobacteriota bacterium]